MSAILCALIVPLLAWAQAAVDLSSLVKLTASQASASATYKSYNRVTKESVYEVNVANLSGQVLKGPVYLVVEGLSGAGVTVKNASGTSTNGLAYYVLSAGDIAAGATQKQTLLFNNPNNARMNFTPAVYMTPVPVQAPLKVEITHPGSLITVGATPLAIEGTINDPTATLTVNGVPITHANGHFAANVALEEGHNAIIARAVNARTEEATATISVSLDLTPPYVTIESPLDGAVLTSDVITVSGLINDIVRGTVSEGQANVTVNGRTATVANRSYLAQQIPLQEGPNLIVVQASDQVGNTGSTQITVTYKVPTTQHIELASGQGQQAEIREVLAQPLQVRLLSSGGQAIAGKSVVFRVSQGDGAVGVGTSEEGVAVLATSDASGLAATRFKLGTRAGSGNHRVSAKAVGFEGEVVFVASATPKPGNKVSVNSGNNQRGAASQPLPLPFVVVVTDDGANVIEGASIQYKVVQGEGKFQNGQSTYTTNTDSDGRASAKLTLGEEVGLDLHRVTATLVGTELYAGFTASALQSGNPGQTSISGVVLDNQDHPLPNVTMRVEGTTRQALTNSQGQFKITEVPVGPVHLIADASTTTVPGEWPTLPYNLVTVAGADNPLPAPVYMVKLDTQHAVYVGLENKVVTLPEVPGFKLTVAANSVTFPNGDREGYLSVTPVNVSKIPMAPPNGMQPQFIVTIQPAGAQFDPPAALQLPNVDGHPPGAQVEMYSFDHDLEEFVAIGLGTVSADGTVIASNPGIGVIKAGWHCGSQPNGGGCAANCGECKKCDANCACTPDDGQTPSSVRDVPGDCKKPGCKGGAPAQVENNSDKPDDTCKLCNAGKVESVPNTPQVACGDGSAEQSCLICKDGKCQIPDCDAAGKQASVSLGSDALSVELDGKVKKIFGLLPFSCSSFAISWQGEYETGEDCCKDCSNRARKGRYHQFSGGAEAALECTLGKDVGVDEEWSLSYKGYGLQFEIEASLRVGIFVDPSVSVAAFGKVNPDCDEGCAGFTGGVEIPISGGVRAEAQEIGVEVLTGGGSDFDIFEYEDGTVAAELVVAGAGADIQVGWGNADGCETCVKLSLPSGSFIAKVEGGRLTFLDDLFVINNPIDWSFEYQLWDGLESDCL